MKLSNAETRIEYDFICAKKKSFADCRALGCKSTPQKIQNFVIESNTLQQIEKLQAVQHTSEMKWLMMNGRPAAVLLRSTHIFLTCRTLLLVRLGKAP